MKQDVGSDVREMQRAWQQGRAPLGSHSTFIHSVGFEALETALGPHLADEMLSPTCAGGGILMWKVLPETSKGLCSDGQFTKERYEAHSQARVRSWLRDNWNRSHGLNSCLQTGALSCLAFHVSKA